MNEENPTNSIDDALLQSIHAHALHSRVPVQVGRRCIDGRYAPGTEESGRLARPGGDFGYILLGLALQHVVDPAGDMEAWTHQVYQAILRQGGGFSMHTDRLALELADLPHEAHLDGCAHIRISREQPGAYQLRETLVEQALRRVLEWSQRDGALRLTVLEGLHEERAVLLARGQAYTLEASGPDGMYFFYDEQRDLEFIERLAGVFALPSDQRALLESLRREHTLATLERAAPLLPVYVVQPDLPDPLVQRLADSPFAL